MEMESSANAMGTGWDSRSFRLIGPIRRQRKNRMVSANVDFCPKLLSTLWHSWVGIQVLNRKFFPCRNWFNHFPLNGSENLAPVLILRKPNGSISNIYAKRMKLFWSP